MFVVRICWQATPLAAADDVVVSKCDGPRDCETENPPVKRGKNEFARVQEKNGDGLSLRGSAPAISPLVFPC